MDLILLDSPLAPGAEKPRLFTIAGLDALQRLLGWLGTDRIPSELYVELPAVAGERRLALETLGPRLHDLPAIVYFLVPVTELTAELLGAFEDAKLYNLIVLGSNGSLLAEAEALRNVREYFDGHPDSRLALGAWLKDRAGYQNFQRTRQYQRAGISPEVITSPLFARDGATPVVGTAAATEVPAELLTGLPSCRLFRNVLTFDAYGVVQLCPREQGGMELGHLFTSSPEDLIGAKGGGMAGVGGYAACQSCDWRGRFTWPERRAQRLEQLLAAGALRPAGGGDALARLNPIAQRDLSAAGDEAVAGDLAAFDERLKAWRESMQELDGAEK